VRSWWTIHTVQWPLKCAGTPSYCSHKLSVSLLTLNSGIYRGAWRQELLCHGQQCKITWSHITWHSQMKCHMLTCALLDMYPRYHMLLVGSLHQEVSNLLQYQWHVFCMDKYRVIKRFLWWLQYKKQAQIVKQFQSPW
jgi:hypothetical protein